MTNASSDKKTVALFYGGPSPEHDVSVVTALQIASAIDSARFETLLVYIAPDGRWFTGEPLAQRKNYLFDVESIKTLTQVTLDTNRSDGMQRPGRLRALKTGFFGKAQSFEFDIALPAFHGLYGEDGNIQGLFEQASIPYAGTRTMTSAILMDKAATKYLLKGIGIDALPFAEIKRPGQGTIVAPALIDAAMKEAGLSFPCILKPTHLGSSIGVAKVTSAEETSACLPAIFAMDDSAILEPFVDNLVEYNVAVNRFDGDIHLSAIERPKSTEDLLDFKQKYLSGGSDKGGDKLGGQKNPGQISQGMLSLTRDLNPEMPAMMQEKIRNWATILFEKLPCTGAPRIDFIANGKTSDVWLNEVNPFPGSIGYFLWEAAPDNPLLFTELLTKLLDEAVSEHAKRRLPKDPVPKDARLLKRSLSEG